jgi:hypothetical protein
MECTYVFPITSEETALTGVFREEGTKFLNII